MNTFWKNICLVRLLLQWLSLINIIISSKYLFINGQPFLKFKEKQVVLRTGAVMKLKNLLILVSQNSKKILQMSVFVAFILYKFQAFFPSKVFIKNSEHECSWLKLLEASKTSDILKCYYNHRDNGNIKLTTLVNTGILYKYFPPSRQTRV